MNRQLMIVIWSLGMVAGVAWYLLTRSAEPPRQPLPTEPAPVKREAPAPKSAAEALLEREPEQPVLATPRTRSKAAPAASETPAPAAAPASGTLHIEADVPGAQVFLDREFVGTSPVTAEHVAPGTHKLNVSAEGYDGIAETIEVTPGERHVRVKFREVRLDAEIDVIHKHRLGSCRGRLVATPQGMRYETTDKNDAFSVALTDLEVFQVAYLEKNLKVKPRKGKQYNFTDPQEGNADRLFVFHRDVDKARERLKKGDPPAARQP